MSRREEFVSHMEQSWRGNDVAMRDVTNKLGKEEFASRMAIQMKRCSHEGCTNQVQKGGVCLTHGANNRDVV